MLSRDSFNKEGVGRTLAYLQFPIKFREGNLLGNVSSNVTRLSLAQGTGLQ